jgi:hypothetical protein
MNHTPDQIRQSIVHAPDDRAKSAPASGVPAQIDFWLSTYAEVEWFQHREFHGTVVTDFCGFLRVGGEWVFCMGSIWTTQAAHPAGSTTHYPKRDSAQPMSARPIAARMLVPAALAQNMTGWFFRLSSRCPRDRKVPCRKVRASARNATRRVTSPTAPIRIVAIPGLRGSSFVACINMLGLRPKVRRSPQHARATASNTDSGDMADHPHRRTQSSSMCCSTT